MAVRDMLGGGALYYAVYGACVVLLVVGAVAIVRRLQVREEAGTEPETAGNRTEPE